MRLNKKQKISIHLLKFAPSHQSATTQAIGLKPGYSRGKRESKFTTEVDQSYLNSGSLKKIGRSRPVTINKDRQLTKVSKILQRETDYPIHDKLRMITEPLQSSEIGSTQVLESMENKKKQQLLARQRQIRAKIRKNQLMEQKSDSKNDRRELKIEDYAESNKGNRQRTQSAFNPKIVEKSNKKTPVSLHQNKKIRPIQQIKQQNLVDKWTNPKFINPIGEFVEEHRGSLWEGQLKVSHLIEALFVKEVLEKKREFGAKLNTINAIIDYLERTLARQHQHKVADSITNAKWTGPWCNKVSDSINRPVAFVYSSQSQYRMHQTQSCCKMEMAHAPANNNDNTLDVQAAKIVRDVQNPAESGLSPQDPPQDGNQSSLSRLKLARKLFQGSQKNNDFSGLGKSMLNTLSMSIHRNKKVESMHMERTRIMKMYRNFLSKNRARNPKSKDQPNKQNVDISKVSNDLISSEKPKSYGNFLKKRQGKYAQIIEQININRQNKSSKQSSVNQTVAIELTGAQTQNGEQLIDQKPQPKTPTKEKTLTNNSIKTPEKTESQIESQKNEMPDEQIEKILQNNKKLLGFEEDDDKKVTFNTKNRVKHLRPAELKNRRKQSFRKINSLENRTNISYTNSLDVLENILRLQKKIPRISQASIHRNTSAWNEDHQFVFENQIEEEQRKKDQLSESEIRKQQDNLLNELYAEYETTIVEKKPAGQVFVKVEKIVTENEGPNRIKQLKELKQQFKKMLNDRINIEGPSVFCRVGVDRSNLIGFNGFGEFQSIYMLKKPKYLQSSYSIKNKSSESLQKFSHDSFQIDFMKKLCSEAGRLGQKSIWNN